MTLFLHLERITICRVAAAVVLDDKPTKALKQGQSADYRAAPGAKVKGQPLEAWTRAAFGPGQVSKHNYVSDPYRRARHVLVQCDTLKPRQHVLREGVAHLSRTPRSLNSIPAP